MVEKNIFLILVCICIKYRWETKKKQLFHGGMKLWFWDFSVSEQETWMDAANRIVEKSRMERNKCCQLRSNAEVLTTKVAQEMWDSWNNTNNALAFRSSELLEAKTKLEQHLQKV